MREPPARCLALRLQRTGARELLRGDPKKMLARSLASGPAFEPLRGHARCGGHSKRSRDNELKFPMGGKLCGFVLLSVACVFTTHARAQSPESLTVDREPGAEDCPDAATLGVRIAHIRGRAGGPSRASYDVSFSHTTDTFTAVIHGGANSESQRVLEGRGLSCTALAQATAVTLALLFDSEVDSTPPDTPKPEPPPAAPPPKVAPLLADPILVDVRARGPRVDGTLSLGVSGLVGVLRPLSPAVTGELGLQVLRWRMGIGVLWNPPQSLSLDPGAIRESLLAGTARSCLALTRSSGFRFDLCTGLFAGIATADANGFTTNEHHVVRTWLAIPLELSLAQLSGPVGWEVSVSALGSLVHEDFSIDHLGAVYRAPRVAGMLSLRAVGLLSL